jgi:hypothetical protein
VDNSPTLARENDAALGSTEDEEEYIDRGVEEEDADVADGGAPEEADRRVGEGEREEMGRSRAFPTVSLSLVCTPDTAPLVIDAENIRLVKRSQVCVCV